MGSNPDGRTIPFAVAQVGDAATIVNSAFAGDGSADYALHCFGCLAAFDFYRFGDDSLFSEKYKKKITIYKS